MFRVAIAWLLYGIGDALSKLPGRLSQYWYPVYNRLMCWSDDLQGDDKRGPWEDFE